MKERFLLEGGLLYSTRRVGSVTSLTKKVWSEALLIRRGEKTALREVFKVWVFDGNPQMGTPNVVKVCKGPVGKGVRLSHSKK